jgi:predicted N-acetyltransferase YhbS
VDGQHAARYAMLPESEIKSIKRSVKMEPLLRNEEEKDFNIVENITREAFWNMYTPGCDEHLLLHNLRNSKDFVKELDFVAIYNNQIVGNIVYAKTKIINADKEYTVLTFGPISVAPEYQRKGIGSKLVEHSKEIAKEMGYQAIIIYGDPAYYSRFGFQEAKNYNITDKNGAFSSALLVLELYQDALNDINGIFNEGDNYNINERELKEFDKGFVKKEKGPPKKLI